MKIICLLFIFTLYGCASTMELKPTGSYIYEASTQDTYDYIRGRTHKCWRRPGGLLQDGIHIVKADINGKSAIIVSNTYMSGPYNPNLQKNTVAQIVFQPLGENRTQVEISEGGYLAGATLGLNADVKRWISGDKSCGK